MRTEIDSSASDDEEPTGSQFVAAGNDAIAAGGLDNARVPAAVVL
ncbi:hypothetical protein PF003_g18184 [Phytophthora fragariae]|nr:hypothetical protein PF003_g18176 [Phytophthora fragariae]KAE8897439.1 hypothetical protein PF003_g18174 [Phytophthora fragariae]KAE8897441.1 hypothetical protein PF003_g18172 [Phytophthora fragariae]KAE8897444.1 hypothetical protein PF003_g18178 [Phytophthora fragariae]KAE8897811.1 hypothetical protein PF003_g18182 [Phytophthora fragariae]